MVARCGQSPMLSLLVLCSCLVLTASDGRCYLREGRSSGSFSVSELALSGDVIGELDVVGDVGSDIGLGVVGDKRNSHFVDIAPATKTLVLRGKLDKEGVEGPSQLHVSVRCQKRNSTDPPIVIPVRIVVQDANDNAPTFQNAPYVLRLSEVMTPGMLVTPSAIRAVDGDQPGPFSTVEYGVEPGPFSHYVAFESALSPALVLGSPLDYETLPEFAVNVTARDKGQPPLSTRTTLTVHVLDADDQNPRFLERSYTALLPDTNLPNDVLRVAPSAIRAEDQDRGLNVTVEYSLDDGGGGDYFRIERRSGAVSLAAAVPDQMAFPVTLVIRATQADNDDRRALATLTVSRGGARSGLGRLRFLSPSFHLNVPENLPVGSVLLALQTNRPYEQLLYTLSDDHDGRLHVTDKGELVLRSALDYESRQRMAVEVAVSSGRARDVTKVDVDVIDVNEHDPKFDSAAYRFEAPTADDVVGFVRATDADRDDSVRVRLVGAHADAFYLDGDGGLRLRNSTLLNSTVAHLVAVAVDDGKPPRSSSAPVEVRVASALVQATLEVGGGHLLMVLAAALAVLLLVVVVLAAYVVKRKHKRDRVGLAPVYPSSQRPLGKMAGYMATASGHRPLTTASPASSDDSGRNVVVAAADRRPAAGDDSSSDDECGRRCCCHLDDDDESVVSGGALRRSSMRLGPSPVPRRVKKLSWEDERRRDPAVLDAETSVAPYLAKTLEHPDLTVYF